MPITNKQLLAAVNSACDELEARCERVEVEGRACVLGQHYFFQTVMGTACSFEGRITRATRLSNGGSDIFGFQADGTPLGIHTRGWNDDGPWQRVPAARLTHRCMGRSGWQHARCDGSACDCYCHTHHFQGRRSTSERAIVL